MILTIINEIARRLHSERGTALVEYALLVLLIAIVAIIGVQLAGTELSEQYSGIASGLASANGN